MRNSILCLGFMAALLLVFHSECRAQGWTVYSWTVTDDTNKYAYGSGGYVDSPGYASAQATGTKDGMGRNDVWIDVYSRKAYHTTQFPIPNLPTISGSAAVTGNASGAGYAFSGADWLASGQYSTSFANPYSQNINIGTDGGGIWNAPWYYADVECWARADAYWNTGSSGTAYSDSTITITP